MTENEIRAKVVATAKKYLGCNESDGSHKKIIDIYNSHRPPVRGYAMKYTDAWCAAFVSAVAIELQFTGIMPIECGCQPMIELYRKLGRWQENDAYVPKAGDILFYHWNDGSDFASTDNTGRANHVGIVAGVSGRVMTVIEGNRNHAVALRYINVNGKFIRGYGLPDYAARATASAPGPAAKKCPYAEPSRNIRFGCKGAGVKWVQWHLNAGNSGEKLAVDGDFGVLTKAAVLRFQKKKALATDGIVGAKTRAALKKAVK